MGTFPASCVRLLESPPIKNQSNNLKNQCGSKLRPPMACQNQWFVVVILKMCNHFFWPISDFSSHPKWIWFSWRCKSWPTLTNHCFKLPRLSADPWDDHWDRTQGPLQLAHADRPVLRGDHWEHQPPGASMVKPWEAMLVGTGLSRVLVGKRGGIEMNWVYLYIYKIWGSWGS